MRSWSQPSPEQPAPPGEGGGSEEALDGALMRRRFIEALRRAEIIALISGAESERQLGRELSEELCEVYDAEIGLLAEVDERGRWREVGMHGVAAGDRERALGAAELRLAASSGRAIAEGGTNLLGLGARTCALAGYRAESGRRFVVGAARLYDQRFDRPEVALLEAVTISAGQALERLRASDERTELIAQLKEAFVGTAEALANALEAKDNYTATHASEVADLAVAVGGRLGIKGEELEQLRYAAIFHDIGKIAIPDAILNKPEPLSESERAQMMEHPRIGAEMIAPIPFLGGEVGEMVRHDHEHWDGSGYPDGLSGERIPLGARIILVVDSYHAMISDRPYRKALTKQEALAELARCSGTQFDPTVVGAFVSLAY